MCYKIVFKFFKLGAEGGITITLSQRFHYRYNNKLLLIIDRKEP